MHVLLVGVLRQGCELAFPSPEVILFQRVRRAIPQLPKNSSTRERRKEGCGGEPMEY